MFLSGYFSPKSAAISHLHYKIFRSIVLICALVYRGVDFWLVNSLSDWYRTLFKTSDPEFKQMLFRMVLN